MENATSGSCLREPFVKVVEDGCRFWEGSWNAEGCCCWLWRRYKAVVMKPGMKSDSENDRRLVGPVVRRRGQMGRTGHSRFVH